MAVECVAPTIVSFNAHFPSFHDTIVAVSTPHAVCSHLFIQCDVV
jgi:hypothetical protein